MTEPLTSQDLANWQGNLSSVTDALAIVRDYCGWHIAPSRTETVTLDANCGSTFILPSLHVTAVASVTYNGTTLGATYYEWSTAGVLRLLNRYYYPGTTALRNIVAQITHGYDDLPGTVRQVALALADRGSSPANIRQVGDITLAVSADDVPAGSVLTNAERAVLDRFRLPVLA